MSKERYACCYLSVVPVRKDPNDRSEMVTQLIFGDTCEIIGTTEDSKWLKIRLEFDNYEGWVDPKQLTELDEITYLKQLTQKVAYLLEGPAQINTGKQLLNLSVASRLFITKKKNLQLHNETIEVKVKSGVLTKKHITQVAGLFLGTPYLWGGKSQFGIDCSGLVQQVFKVCGKKLPRDAYQQALEGDEVAFEDIKPGDLAFFKNDSGNITHVGIVVEMNNIIHAHGEVRIDVLDKKGIYNTGKNYYSHLFVYCKRIFT